MLFCFCSGYIAKYDITSLMAGVMLSGFVTTKLRPSARQLQGFSMFVAALAAMSTAGYMFIGCDQPGLGALSQNLTECATTCDCDDVKFAPICGADLTTYSSPCEAGCVEFNEFTKNYENCSCILDGGSAREGPCKSEICMFPFYFFLATQATTNFLAACTWTSATIIVLR